MKILVISNSLIVQELLKLVLDNREDSSEYIQKAQDAEDINYDIVFIDDFISNLKRQIDFVKSSLKAKRVILLGGEKDLELGSIVDIILKKPFLPADIEDVLGKFNNKDISTNILDPEEIAKIKVLMELDEDSSEDELSYIEMLENKESLKLKKRDAKEFLYEILKLNKKELKALLKGAKVSIKVEFKDNNE